MRINRGALLLAALLALGFLGACSDTRTPIGTPHPLGKAWIVEGATFHGDAYEQKTLDCSQCHDIDTFCTQCHFNPTETSDVRVPPGSGWVHQAPPPSHAFLASYGDTCKTCHTLLRQYGAGPALCHDCHGPASPHPEGWVDPTNPNFHGSSAEANVNSCKVCHGNDLTGGQVGVSCYQCHFGPDGSRQPPTVDPSVWDHQNAKINHASKDLLTADQKTVCTTCHGLENQYRGQPAFTDCTSATCHPSLASAYHGLNAFAQHPANALQNIGSCSTCHNTPTPPPNFNGYVTGVACPTCHDQGIAHPPGPPGAPDWYIDHRSSGNRATSCSICHDVTQGRTAPLSAAPSCFSASFNAQPCHSGGPGTAPHPTDGSYVNPELHGADAKGDPGLVFCQKCHATPPSGATPTPRFNVPLSSRIPQGCETCHAPGTAHPSAAAGDVGGFHWYGPAVTHRNAKNIMNSCTLCHGANLEGGVGPACTLCHTAGSPVTLSPCISCHGAPPNDASATATLPNRQGAHGTHNALPGVTGVCNTCHNGGGTGTAPHFNDQRNPFMSFLSTYNALTGGPAKFTVTDASTKDGTCSGVSCHGGQTTPNWLTGTIDVSTDCTECHVAETAATKTQYNSAASGQHDRHVNELHYACTVCHDADKLLPGSSHFADLKTPDMEGAAATIGGGSTSVTSYDSQTQTCTAVCHQNQPMSWAGD